MRAVGSYKSTHFIIPHSSPSSYRIRSITIFSTHQQFSHFSPFSQPRSARENRKAKVGHQAGVRCQRHCDFSQMNQNSPPSHSSHPSSPRTPSPPSNQRQCKRTGVSRLCVPPALREKLKRRLCNLLFLCSYV